MQAQLECYKRSIPMLMKSQNIHREPIYMRLCRYTVRINRIDDSGNTIAQKRKIGRAEVKAMRFQGRRRASVWCRSRTKLLKCFSIPWRRDTITFSRLLLASVIEIGEHTSELQSP